MKIYRLFFFSSQRVVYLYTMNEMKFKKEGKKFDWKYSGTQ